MRQERLLLIFFLTLSFSLGSLQYGVKPFISFNPKPLLYQSSVNKSSTLSKHALIGIHDRAWFALKLNADPVLYLNSLSDLLKKVPAHCLGTFSEGDQIKIIMNSITCRFSKSRLNGKIHRALGIAISINHASVNDLLSVPKIGPKLAQKIIDHRPYSTLEDLLSLSGVGHKRLAQIRSYLTTYLSRRLWSTEAQLENSYAKIKSSKLSNPLPVTKSSALHIDSDEVVR